MSYRDGYGYGGEHAAFDVTPSCTMQTPHASLVCTTAEGAAGASIAWTVEVDGQRSTAPRTSAAPPVVLRVGGAAAQHARSAGGDELVVHGAEFASDQSALDWVRLGDVGDADEEEGGASSTWFEATRCAIVAEHQTIRCAFPPGGGRELPVRVSIGGQRSAPTAASATVSYAAPTITRVAPNLTATDEDAVTLTGANLGVGTLLAVQWDGGGAPLPIVAPSDGASIVVRSPPGTGRDHTLVAVHMLGTPFAQRSAPASVHYAPPRIHDVARRGDAAAGRLALFVLGENFGSTPGAVVDASELAKRQNGGAPEPCEPVVGSWSHRDLVCTLASDRELATLVVTVDG